MLKFAAISGHENGFAHIYREHREAVFQHAFRFCACMQEAQDITQDVFTRCFLSGIDFSGVEDIPGYLFMATRNRFLDLQKRRQREQIGLRDYSLHYRQLWPPTEDPVQEKEYAKLIRQAVDQLPPRQQQVFTLSRELLLKRKEIARRLNMSAFTVKEHNARAVKSVKAFIQSKLDQTIKR